MVQSLESPHVVRAFTHLSQAQAAKAALDLCSEELLGKSKSLDIAAFRAVEQGQKFTPDDAMRLFYAKHALWKLLQSLEQKLAAGQGAAKVLRPQMEGHVDA